MFSKTEVGSLNLFLKFSAKVEIVQPGKMKADSTIRNGPEIS